MKVTARLVVLVLLPLNLLTVSGAGAQPPPKGAGIYVADRLNGRIVYMKDMSGAGWVTFGTTGKGTKQFDNPSLVHSRHSAGSSQGILTISVT